MDLTSKLTEVKPAVLIGGFSILFAGLVAAAISMGAYSLSFSEIGDLISGSTTSKVNSAVFWNLRLPRVLLAIIIGAALSSSGAAIQGVFRNPLADPSLIGISSGALLCTALYIVATGGNAGIIGTALAAFSGAFISALAVMSLSLINKKIDVTTMLLVGIAFNALAGAFTGFLLFVADEKSLRDITFWTLGSLNGANWETVLVVMPFSLGSIVYLPQLGRSLNLFALGESEAQNMGVQPQQLKLKVILLATLAVGACVALAGFIGFMGLIVPHLARLIFGSDFRKILPATLVLGSSILLLADTFARNLIQPAEIPIGILISLLGTPVFFSLLLKLKTSKKL